MVDINKTPLFWLPLVLLAVACPGWKKSGCENDTDCKGDRICEQRRCVPLRPKLEPTRCPEPRPCPRPPPCPVCPAPGSEGSSQLPAEADTTESSNRHPRVLGGGAEVRGSLSKEIIRRIIRHRINEVKYCYQRELEKANPGLSGRVIVQFTIAATGQVVVSKIQSSTLQSPRVESCIAATVRRWLFPRPKGGGIVIVSYPFILKSAP